MYVHHTTPHSSLLLPTLSTRREHLRRVPKRTYASIECDDLFPLSRFIFSSQVRSRLCRSNLVTFYTRGRGNAFTTPSRLAFAFCQFVAWPSSCRPFCAFPSASTPACSCLNSAFCTLIIAIDGSPPLSSALSSKFKVN